MDEHQHFTAADFWHETYLQVVRSLLRAAKILVSGFFLLFREKVRFERK